MTRSDSSTSETARTTTQDWERRYNRLCVGMCIAFGLLALTALAMCSGCNPDEATQSGTAKWVWVPDPSGRGWNLRPVSPSGTVRQIAGGGPGPKRSDK